MNWERELAHIDGIEDRDQLSARHLADERTSGKEDGFPIFIVSAYSYSVSSYALTYNHSTDVRSPFINILSEEY